MMRTAHLLGLLVLGGCSSTNIIYVTPEGGAGTDANADSRSDAMVIDGSSEANDGSSDGGFDAASDADNDSSVCVNGTQACVDVWTSYCSRLKACCNGNCPNVWQNQPNGPSDCNNHFLGMSSATYCQQQRSSDMRCEQPCLGDVQNGSCNAIMIASYQNGVPSSGATCQNFWQ